MYITLIARYFHGNSTYLGNVMNESSLNPPSQQTYLQRYYSWDSQSLPYVCKYIQLVYLPNDLVK